MLNNVERMLDIGLGLYNSKEKKVVFSEFLIILNKICIHFLNSLKVLSHNMFSCEIKDNSYGIGWIHFFICSIQLVYMKQEYTFKN